MVQGFVGRVGGHGVVSHGGSGLLRLVADRVGLTSALSEALARPGSDRCMIGVGCWLN